MKKEALVRRLCILLFLSVCLFVFWGTKRGLWIDRTKGSLINIDTLLTRNLLDSARNELDEISLNRIQSKADSAYYFLLNTETNYRLHGPNPSDSSICYSVNYYESTNNKELLARAYYYKGVSVYYTNNIEKAISYTKKAESIAANTNNKQLKHKIYESLSYFNSVAYKEDIAYDYAKHALDLAKQLGDKEKEAIAYIYLAADYSEMGMMDSLAFCIQQCQPLINFLKDGEKTYLYTRMGELYADDEPELAKSYLKKALAIHPQSWTLRALSDIYTKENNIAEANKVWDMAVAFKGGTKARTSILKAMRGHYAQIKDFQKANTVADSIIALQQRYYEDQERDRIAEIQAKYDKEQAVVLFRAKYTKWISAAIIMLLLVISVLLYKNYRGMKAEKELAEQERDLEHLRQERCELNEEKRQNEEERSRLEEKIAELRGYEQQTADLQRQLDETNKQLDDIGTKETEHKKEIEHLQQKINDLGARHSGILARGKELYGQIEQGGSTIAWSRNDFVDYIEYYKLLDISFINHLETDYDGLSPKYTFFALLEQQGKTDEQIMNIMGISENTMRSTRSRIRGKQISPTA